MYGEVLFLFIYFWDNVIFVKIDIYVFSYLGVLCNVFYVRMDFK